MNNKQQFVTYILITALAIETVHPMEHPNIHEPEESQATLIAPPSGSYQG